MYVLQARSTNDSEMLQFADEYEHEHQDKY